ncbi:MAG: hypothetical protein IKV30_07585 [Clostridia bacterium]|nr:hypothetical protein [Clostridia bacterium]
MRNINRAPIVSAIICYYDTSYEYETAVRVLAILKKYNFFPPEKIHADHLTKNKYIYTDTSTEQIFVNAYSEKNVLGLDMASNNGNNNVDYWRFSWNYTFLKNKKSINSIFVPWNVITLSSTYKRLTNTKMYNDYIACVKELIVELNPFFASVEDAENTVRLMGRSKDKRVNPERIPHVSWGNYINTSIYNCKEKEPFLKANSYFSEIIGDGIWFTLGPSMIDINSIEVNKRRKIIEKYLI